MCAAKNPIFVPIKHAPERRWPYPALGQTDRYRPKITSQKFYVDRFKVALVAVNPWTIRQRIVEGWPVKMLSHTKFWVWGNLWVPSVDRRCD
jgi:hypothetical protein